MACRCVLMFAYKQTSETLSWNTHATFLRSCCSIIIFRQWFLSLFIFISCCSSSFSGRTGLRGLNTSISQILLLHSLISEVCAFPHYCRDEWRSLGFPWSPPEKPVSDLSKMVTARCPGPWSHPPEQMAKQGSWQDGSGSAVQWPTCHFCIIWWLVSQYLVCVSPFPTVVAQTQLATKHHAAARPPLSTPGGGGQLKR